MGWVGWGSRADKAEGNQWNALQMEDKRREEVPTTSCRSFMTTVMVVSRDYAGPRSQKD